ncbi:alpha/beta hydrolase [Nocardia sp. NPDC088792]|uniref:alpha/beta hydrolase n=1 Tax=Nocardia sp. NPDC088792 TaxID=3364332 RepID=UPI00382AAF4F
MKSARGRLCQGAGAILAATVLGVFCAGVAQAEPPAYSGAQVDVDGSHLDHVVQHDDRRATFYVYSAAMNRVIAMQVILPADNSAPRPTLYLLNGAEDGIDGNGQETSWETKTDLVSYMGDQNVNVVNILDGRYSYYTDWQTDDPVIGRNKWTTFLTQELPPIIDSALNTSGANAIAGVSMSATSVLALAEDAPGLYRSVGSFSGCAQTSTDPGRRYLQVTVLSGGANPWNIWGPDGSPAWTANDPSTDANLVKLRGTDLYIAAGSGPNGTSGPAGNMGSSQPAMSSNVLESTVAGCTQALQASTERLGIPATYSYLPNGGHNWPSWQIDFHAAWPGMARSLGI